MELTQEVFQHVGLEIETLKQQIGNDLDFLDWAICKTEDAAALTGNMAGFGMEHSQRIIIDYDKEYGYILVRREKFTGEKPQALRQ